ncbi:hypothetical protein Murru_0749 [Allomuricauda ruestringensis DSM 13258]|uniref:Uncharacterized protein n=1 Tax=Allomuricauda ruestringensis (strain DSM 13258 / CIP 107369 / LMG 19739 / B1) TaxID=886377 RepID=G2PJP0_ALLRU|nr:hypothetical protein [Allomuricauda ruestringensis]AEM69798.1 hypothetical protein Murru_0749 [Allomuricauda ruestringensis DSM 13258]
MKIPEIKLISNPETKEAREALGFQWNEVAGTRHKLGGEPDGITEEQFPKCDSCNNPMSFYAQIDSIGDNYNLADCMVIHQFVCFDCFEVACKLNQTKV